MKPLALGRGTASTCKDKIDSRIHGVATSSNVQKKVHRRFTGGSRGDHATSIETKSVRIWKMEVLLPEIDSSGQFNAERADVA